MAEFRILLVGNDDELCRILAMLLESHGYRVQIANGYEPALEAAGATLFHLLISDIALPRRSGADLLRELNQRARIPGIAIAGSSDPVDRLNAEQAGFLRCMGKPIHFMEMVAAIEKCRRDGESERGASGLHA